MIKHFCDLCGKPAIEQWPEMRAEFPEKAWSGSKSESGSIGCVEGRWTPYVSARIVFESHDMPQSTTNYNPDICQDCASDLLHKIANSVRRAK